MTQAPTKPEPHERIEHDPAKIPAPFLTNEQTRVLQQEVLKLREKRRQQRKALADLHRAMERKSHLLTRSNTDRNALLDDFEDLRSRYDQLRAGRK